MKNQLVCIMVVGLVEVPVMMCIADYFNGHVGTAETGE